jgi:hypothetical protein
VRVGAEPGIVGQIPTVMIRVIVDDNLIRVPQPIVDVVILERRNAEVKTVEPKPFAVSAAEVPHMPAPDSTGEATVLPGVVHMKAWIFPACIMTDPLIVPMDVRGFRVPSTI